MGDYNVTVADFAGKNRICMTDTLYQYDYGQKLQIDNIPALPQTYEAHFSNVQHGGVSITVTGMDGIVDIPNALLMTGKRIYCWIYVTEPGSGETEYQVLMPVQARPMPEYYDVTDTGAFDSVVQQVGEYAATATAGATSATASAAAAATSASEAAASASAAETAKIAAETAQDKAEDAQAAAETAAQTATEKAQQTAQDAAQAAQSKADAESAAGRAEAAQTGAESAKTDAETAAQGAAASASAASASATSAGQAATSAAQSATAAAGSATTAQGAAQTATAKAGEASASATAAAASETAAQTAQAGAETAATNAGQSASTATAKAAEAAQSASNAAQSKTDAEAAAARAEQAAASLTVDDALSDTSTNPVQNKVVTGEFAQVKSAIEENKGDIEEIFDLTGGTYSYVPRLRFISGEYYKPAVTSATNAKRADYIPVLPGDIVTIKTTYGSLYNCYFFNADKSSSVGIGGIVGTTEQTFTVPSGRTWLGLSNSNNNHVENVVISIQTTREGEFPSEINALNNEVKYINARNNARKKVAPLFVSMTPDYMWVSRYEIAAFSASLPKYVDGDVAADNNAWFKITGTGGSDTVTIVSGGNGDISDLTATEKTRPFGAVIGYDDGTFEPCNAQYVNDTTFSIYPSLKQSITNGQLAQIKTIIHLSRRGYIGYAQHLYNQTRRHCEKSRYIAKWRAQTGATVFPWTTYYGSAGGMINGIVRTNMSDLYVDHILPDYYRFGCLNMTSAQYNDKESGIIWAVPINGYRGYVELFIGAKNADSDYNLASGDEYHIELWVDGVKKAEKVKTTKVCERVCLDFDGGTTAELRIYRNRWRETMGHFLMNRVTWWVNDVFFDNEPLLPNGTVPTLLFDSWGTFDDAQTYETLKSLIDETAGTAVPFYNESVGGKTSQWGRDNFFALTFAHNSKAVLVDFGINDQGISMTQADYNKYMSEIIDFALNNGIQPIVVGIALQSYQTMHLGLIDTLATQIE